MPSGTGFKGVDVKQTGNELVFDAFLLNSSGTILATGTTTLSLAQLMSDGTLQSYDFNSNTFKTTALTTATENMTQQTTNNATTNSGIWTYSLATLTGFAVGAVYYAIINNTGASPQTQVRKFQYGGAEGDLAVTANGTGVAELNTNPVMWQGGTIPATSQTGVPITDPHYWNGTAFVSTATAGIPDINVKNIGNQAAQLDGNNLLKVDVVDFGGTAGTFTAGVPTVTFNNTSIATVTNLTNLPAIPANWLTSAGIAASALNGKGDWLLASNYTAPNNADIVAIFNALPTNLADLLIDSSGRVVLQPSGLDAVLIEQGITASAALKNDAGSQLTSINGRQALAVLLATSAAIVSGSGVAPSTILYGTTGLPSGNNRVKGTCDQYGNRSNVDIVVPT